ncbi:cytochrome P450 [Microbispora sp. H10670]|uniref:cytochrome P450 n=1 Tax=Microbispora sp. H10670 TaxID=2729108 RepID=UPI001601EABE|nr:cytochrome P450 [Microbispora sp. H10670]
MTTAADHTAIAPVLDGPRGLPLLGSLPEFARDPLAFLSRLASYPADQVRWRLGPTPVVFLNNPEMIHEVLAGREFTFRKPDLGYAFRHLLGDGFITSRGPEWRRKRGMVQPAVRPRQVRAYAEIMSAAAQELAARWAPGRRVDVTAEMLALSQRITVRTIFGTDAGVREEVIADSMLIAQHQIGVEFRGLGPMMPDWMRTPGRRRLKRAVDVLDTEVRRLVTLRRESPTERDDLLTRLLAARDASGAHLTDKEIRDECVTMYVGAHETTGTALTWVWYLLSRHPRVRERLTDELRRVLNGRVPGYEDYARLPYCEQIVKEALRMRPPVWMIYALADEGATLAGRPLRKGTQVWMSPWATHFDPRWFGNPQEFSPERWARDASSAETVTESAWFPFGGGTRVCIGVRFAMVASVLVLATIAQRFHLEVEPGEFAPKIGLTLQPEGTMHASLRPVTTD